MTSTVGPARRSVEKKLPLIIGALLVAAIAATSALALYEVRLTSVQLAADRLAGASDELRESLRQSVTNQRALAATIASRPGIAAFAARRDPALEPRALADLALPGAQPATFVGADLRDGAGRILASTLPAHFAAAARTVNDVLPHTEPGDSAVVGSFRVVGDTVMYPVAAAVPGAADVYVVRWRRLGTPQRSRELIENLIGSDASLLIGNADGGTWSNFARPVAGPRLDAGSGAEGIHDYERDGERYLASVRPIPGTPWLVAVDFPRTRVMEPVAIFAGRQAFVAAVVLLLGLAAAWLVSRRITRPVKQLTLAAEAMAAGDYDQHPNVRTRDEFGVLASAFTTMATEVKESRDRLEHKVEERTAELNSALEQLHETQDALVRRERLAMLGQLSSGVGHELRNPLGVMTNAVYYLRAVLGQAPAGVHEYLDILTQQITLSEKIVSDLLDFARQKPPRRSPALLRESVESQVQRLAPRDAVQITVDAPDDLAPVLVDPVHLNQIVLNLLTNAVQAMDGNGRVTVRARANGTMQQLEVADTGPGVAPENAEKIFEPLFTTKARGIGLGLAVSRTLARANGGDLALVTEPLNRGATFRLTLPIAEGGTT